MKIYTDNARFADSFLEKKLSWNVFTPDMFALAPELNLLARHLFEKRPFFQGEIDTWHEWREIFLVEEADRSHYDLLVDMSRSDVMLPDKIICLAGSSSYCHGQRGRPWIALPGNLHLAAYFKPGCRIQGFGSGFPALAAVSVVQALDDIEPLEEKASIKWVNDVVVSGAKVAGFLAHSQSKETLVQCAVLGIGLNVARTPDIEPDMFVTEAASVSSFVEDKSACSQKKVLGYLLDHLNNNYLSLLNGNSSKLVDLYRKRSIVIGKNVRIFSDPVNGEPKLITSGKVDRIGDNLELYLEGDEKPVSRGRLVLE